VRQAVSQVSDLALGSIAFVPAAGPLSIDLSGQVVMLSLAHGSLAVELLD
jgi:hypothetical protein